MGSLSFSLFATFRCLFVSYCVLQFVVGDEMSIGVSTCTKLDDQGRSTQFICPNSLAMSEHYCCGVPNYQRCCDYDEHDTDNAVMVASMIIGPLLLFLCCVGTCCFCCRCCCFRNRPQQIIMTHPLTTTMSTTINQPMFVPQGYHPFHNAQNPEPSNVGFNNPTPDSMGKPPPYNP